MTMGVTLLVPPPDTVRLAKLRLRAEGEVTGVRGAGVVTAIPLADEAAASAVRSMEAAGILGYGHH